MTDPEVARLRRLRGVALRVREIARALGSTHWAKDEPLLESGACASWRIARVVSGKLKAHPYLRYQKGESLGALLRNRVMATWLALIPRDRIRGLETFQTELLALMRQLDDARSLTWSTDFSDTLGRSQTEIKSLLQALAIETKNAPAQERVGLAGEIAQSIEGDWPYLAF